MNPVYILNLVFYLLPFVVMIVDHYAYKVTSKIQKLMYLLFCTIFTVVFIYSLTLPLSQLFSYMPSYLFTFYVFALLITAIIHNLLNSSNPLHSITRSFLIVYFSSFYWEVPENIYWQIKLGFNPIISAFFLLSCFSFIYLKNTAGWKKTRANYALLLTSWVVTALGVSVFTLPSSTYCDWRPYLHPCAQYFVFCRIVSVIVLIKIFILDHYLPQQIHRILQEGSFFTYTKWILRYALRGNWRLGTEMGYWDFEINHNRPEGWTLPFITYEIKSAIFRVKKNMDKRGRNIRVLEIGPGPRSRLTSGYDEELYDLVAIDPLADDFKEHLGGRSFLVQGTAEGMYELYPPQSFDISYASNVLDHTSNPQLCFNNLVELTRVGGYIVIQGNTNEGTRTGWQGLHKHDIWVDGDKLMCKTQRGKPFNLAIGLVEKVTGREELLENKSWFSVLYRRTDK